MSVDRSTRTLLAILFLLAALFVAMNRVVESAPAGEWWLPLLLFVLGAGLALSLRYNFRTQVPVEADDDLEPALPTSTLAAGSDVHTYRVTETTTPYPQTMTIRPDPDVPGQRTVTVTEETPSVLPFMGTVTSEGVPDEASGMVAAKVAEGVDLADVAVPQSPETPTPALPETETPVSPETPVPAAEPEPIEVELPSAPETAAAPVMVDMETPVSPETPAPAAEPLPVEAETPVSPETPTPTSRAEPVPAAPETDMPADTEVVDEAPSQKIPLVKDGDTGEPAPDVKFTARTEYADPDQATAKKEAPAQPPTDESVTAQEHSAPEEEVVAAKTAAPQQPYEAEQVGEITPEGVVDESASPRMTAQENGEGTSGSPDNLRKIHGIGKKSAQALKTAGIDSFQKLANSSDDALRTALDTGGVRLVGDVNTWSLQAAYAARGDWQGLDRFNADQGSASGD